MAALPTNATPQGHRKRRRPMNSWKRDLEKEMWIAGFRYSCRKMEAAANAELDGNRSMN